MGRYNVMIQKNIVTLFNRERDKANIFVSLLSFY